jgi:hypothetical protein
MDNPKYRPINKNPSPFQGRELSELERLVVTAFQLGVVKEQKELYSLTVPQLREKVLKAITDREKTQKARQEAKNGEVSGNT